MAILLALVIKIERLMLSLISVNFMTQNGRTLERLRVQREIYALTLFASVGSILFSYDFTTIEGDKRRRKARRWEGGGVTEGEIFRALMVLIMMMLLLLPKLSSFMLPAIKVKIL